MPFACPGELCTGELAEKLSGLVLELQPISFCTSRWCRSAKRRDRVILDVGRDIDHEARAYGV